MTEPEPGGTTTTTPASPVGERQGSSRLVSASMIMAAGTMTSRVLGFGRLMLLVFLFGNSTRQADMFTYANTVPTGLYMLFAGGVLNTVLVPQIVRAVKGDADGGEAYTNRIMTAGLTLLAIIAVGFTVAAPLAIRIYTPSSWREPALAAQYDSTVTLAYYCLPQIFFYGVYLLAGQVLNARDRFGPMMWAPIANNVISIGVLVLFLVVFGQGDGVSPFTTKEEILLGLGATLGIAAQAAVLVWFLRTAGYHFRPRFDFRHAGLGKTFRLAKWTLGFVLVNQLALVVVNRLAGTATAGGVGSGLTAYYNAQAIWILPHSLITVSLATAMLPSASRMAAASDMRGVASETTAALRLAVTAAVPASVAFLALGIPAARLVFGFGKGASGADFVGWTLMALAIGLVPFTVQYICLRAFYALEDNRTTFFLQVVIAGANVVFGIAAVTLLDDPSLVATALGAAYSLAYVIGVALSFSVLKRRLPDLSGQPLIRHCARLLVAVAPAGVAAAAIAWAFTLISDGLAGKIVSLAVAGAVALGIFLLMAHLLHIDEVIQVVGAVLRRRRPTPPPDGAKSAPDEAGVTGDSTALLDAVSPRIDAAPLVAGAPAGHESTENPEPDVIQHGTTQPTSHPSASHPPASHSPASHWAAGTVLAQRYRLEELLGDAEPTLTWRAFDQVLSRSVLVHLLPPDDPRAPELIGAARRAAVATDSRFLRVLDAVEDSDDGVGSYIVCEYAVGQSLEVILSHGPLSGLEAGWVVAEVADALSGVHALGLYHQRVGPDTVIITPTGNVKIVGLLIESTLRPSRGSLLDSARTPENEDVLDLGRLLYATLVSRWPGGPAYGLAAAPVVSHGWMTPRQVRAGVSPPLDQVCDQILGLPPRHRAPLIATANGVVDALTKVLGTVDASGDLERRLRQPVPLVGGVAPVSPLLDPITEPMEAVDLPSSPTGASPLRSAPPSAEVRSSLVHPPTVVRHPPPPVTTTRRLVRLPRPPRRRRRWITVLIAVVALALIAMTVWSVLAVGRRDSSGEAEPGTPTSAPNTAPPAPLTIVGARDFDPQGDDRTENPDQVRLAHDGDLETRWRTVTYYGSANLGNIKRGVGLVVDLGTAVSVSSVTVSLSGDNSTVQARVPTEDPATVSSPPMRSDSQWRTVSQQAKVGKSAVLTFDESVTTRYVLVYLTALPKEGDGYRGGIYEVEVSS